MGLADKQALEEGPGFGVYVHIPYCSHVCPYCDFNVTASRQRRWPALVQALTHELKARRGLFLGPAKTLYFGGGTPSLMPASAVADLIGLIRDETGLPEGAEVTLEANPEGLTADHLARLAAAGVNRLSLGWQSTQDGVLARLGRRHSAAEARAAYSAARSVGFAAVSVDLIFAVPGQTSALLAADLAELVEAHPEHVALYALTYAPHTPMHRARARGALRPVDEAQEVAMMAQVTAALAAAGYAHYEVSNYARPGHQAVHNRGYWQGTPYLGLGPGAHSFARRGWARGWRWQGVRSVGAYLAAWQRAQAPATEAPAVAACPDSLAEAESLTPEQMFTERILCGLRQAEGIARAEPLCRQFLPGRAAAEAEARRLGWLTADRPDRPDRLVPTAAGLRHADALAALFF